MLLVIIPGELSAGDEEDKGRLLADVTYNLVTSARSLPLCCSLVSVKTKKLKKDKSCPCPERGRRVSFTKPDDDLP